MEQAISFPALRERGQPRKEAYSWGRSGRLKIFASLYKQNKRSRQERNTDQEENREKMMWMMTRCSNGNIISNNPPLIDSSTSITLLPDEIVVGEILSRLPAKSLMRFKAVCKRWLPLIQHDAQFRDLHLTRSKKRLDILIVAPIHENEKSLGHKQFEIFLSSNLCEGRAAVQTIRQKKDCMHYNYHKSRKPVNGLICFVHCFKLDCVCIYNPSTREITPWIKTTIRRGNHDRNFPNFEFGFDPVTKQHKVICVWSIDKSRNKPMHTVCEILTLGDNSWRRIDEIPPYKVDGASLYVNGSIYWISKVFHKYHKYDDGAPEVVVAFDVGSEKFRAISIPDFIIDQPREHDFFRGPFIDLLEVDGHLALLCRRNSNIVSMWIFNDVDHDYTNKEKIGTTNATSSSSSNRRINWTEVIITLPFDWVGDMYPNFHSIAGTDQIILECGVLTNARTDPMKGGPRGYHCVHSVYSYIWKNNAFKKIEISGISLPIRSHLFTPTVESLFTPYPEQNYVNVFKERRISGNME